MLCGTRITLANAEQPGSHQQRLSRFETNVTLLSADLRSNYLLGGEAYATTNVT
jgi:hypothetical protein